jgi:hypothetical protein
MPAQATEAAKKNAAMQKYPSTKKTNGDTSAGVGLGNTSARARPLVGNKSNADSSLRFMPVIPPIDPTILMRRRQCLFLP